MTALQLQLNYHTVPLYFKPKSFCLSGKTPVLSFMSSFRDLTVSVGDKFCIAYSFPLHFIVTQSSSTVSLLTAMLFVVKKGRGRLGAIVAFQENFHAREESGSLFALAHAKITPRKKLLYWVVNPSQMKTQPSEEA